MAKLITSPDNSIFKALRDCLQTKGIKKHGQFMVFGERAVHDVLAMVTQSPNLGSVRNLVLSSHHASDAFTEIRELFHGLLPQDADLRTLELSQKLFEEIDAFGTDSPILVLEAPEIPAAKMENPAEGLEVVCSLGDPSNLGALVRSAAAFGVRTMILTAESSSPFHPRAIRAASATTLAMNYLRGPSIRELRAIATGSPMIALDMKGQKLPGFHWPINARLVLGEEGLGVPEQVRNLCETVSIPMAAGVESLNATVAAGIALYSYRSQYPSQADG